MLRLPIEETQSQSLGIQINTGRRQLIL